MKFSYHSFSLCLWFFVGVCLWSLSSSVTVQKLYCFTITFRSMIPVELIFFMVRVKNSDILYFSGQHSDLAPFIEKHHPFLNVLQDCLFVIIYMDVYMYFWTLDPLPLVLFSISVPAQHSLNYWSFIISYPIWKYKSFKIVLCL